MAVHISIVHELLNLISQYNYTNMIGYISPRQSISHGDYHKYYLSEEYWLDTRRCFRYGKENPDQLFEIFGAFNDEDPIDVHDDICNRISRESELYASVGHVTLGMRSLHISDWIKSMQKPDTFSDELMLFALSRTYQHHSCLFTSFRGWSTIDLNDLLSFDEMLTVCHVKLVYIEERMFGELCLKPFSTEWKEIVTAVPKYMVSNKKSPPPALDITVKLTAESNVPAIMGIINDDHDDLSHSTTTAMVADTASPDQMQVTGPTSDMNVINTSGASPSLTINADTNGLNDTEPIDSDSETTKTDEEPVIGINSNTDTPENNMKGINPDTPTEENDMKDKNINMLDASSSDSNAMNDINSVQPLNSFNDETKGTATNAVNSGSIVTMIGLNNGDFNIEDTSIDWALHPDQARAMENVDTLVPSLSTQDHNSDISSECECITEDPEGYLLWIHEQEAKKHCYSVPLKRLSSGDIYTMSGKAPKWSEIDPYSSLKDEGDNTDISETKKSDEETDSR